MNPAITPRPSKSLLIGAIVTGMASLMLVSATAALHFSPHGMILARESGEGSYRFINLDKAGEYLLWENNRTTRINRATGQVMIVTHRGSTQDVTYLNPARAGESRFERIPTYAPSVSISPIGFGEPVAAFKIATPGEYMVRLNTRGRLTPSAPDSTLTCILVCQIAGVPMGIIAITLGLLHRNKTRKAAA